MKSFNVWRLVAHTSSGEDLAGILGRPVGGYRKLSWGGLEERSGDGKQIKCLLQVACFWLILKGIFCHCPCRKMSNFQPKVVILVKFGDVM